MDPNELLHEYLLLVLLCIRTKFDLIRNVTFLSNLQISTTKYDFT